MELDWSKLSDLREVYSWPIAAALLCKSSGKCGLTLNGPVHRSLESAMLKTLTENDDRHSILHILDECQKAFPKFTKYEKTRKYLEASELQILTNTLKSAVRRLKHTGPKFQSLNPILVTSKSKLQIRPMPSSDQSNRLAQDIQSLIRAIDDILSTKKWSKEKSWTQEKGPDPLPQMDTLILYLRVIFENRTGQAHSATIAQLLNLSKLTKNTYSENGLNQRIARINKTPDIVAKTLAIKHNATNLLNTRRQ